ncbi:MAG: hypothetical protein IJ833_01635 [Lachnospiraceae bacterium]|nr:hypothetical protein [Lachnospiraceae bacterium]
MKRADTKKNDSQTHTDKHYEGVFTATKKDGTVYYRASLTFRRKHISLGSFPNQEDAHRAYLEANLLLVNDSMTLLQYASTSMLAFEKWVTLINFRDNGIYFGNPIYLGQKQFFYYLSPTHILKFDMDDLFYFSSHKIMCRGNHYFVADYGMQVNIASRYGIKNYAVLGVDYNFINGDTTDFRRENIEILNTYHGVRPADKKGRPVFVVRIHIRGNYVVGYYEDELTAAIAYNKAIDILHKKGVNKNFTPNYIEGLSPRKYAEIYASVEIAPKILSYEENQAATSPHNQ